MNTVTIESTAVQAEVAAPARAPRVDLYQPIHKALRAFMSDTLGRLGVLDVADAAELRRTLDQADSLLALMANHLRHEERFMHPLLEAAHPGITGGTVDEHDGHRASMQALRDEAAALREAPADEAALRLYRHFALFVAENLQHMHFEETVLNAALWAQHDDGELLALHGRLLASIGDDEKALTLRWMLPALTPAQRAGFVIGLQREAPPEVVRGVLDAVRPHLDDAAWAKLARAAGLPPVPGLVTA